MSSFYGHWEGRGVEVTAMIKTGLCSLGIPCADWKQGQAVESGVRSADMGPGRLNGCDVAGGSFMKPEQWIPARAEAWMRTWAVGSETELCVGRCGYISDLSGQEHLIYGMVDAKKMARPRSRTAASIRGGIWLQNLNLSRIELIIERK